MRIGLVLSTSVALFSRTWIRRVIRHLHRSAVRWANALVSWLNLRQLFTFGKSVSSAGALVMMVGGGKEAVLAEGGYIPTKLCWTDSRARDMGVARR